MSITYKPSQAKEQSPHICLMTVEMETKAMLWPYIRRVFYKFIAIPVGTILC